MKNAPIIETRKVHSIGDGGLCIVLPIDWAREKEIEKGSEVLVVADNQLVIEADNPRRINEAHLAIEKFIQGIRHGD